MLASATLSPCRRRVLIVEDDTLVVVSLRSQLESLGHEIAGHARTAIDALKTFFDTKPDVVLLDIRLDGADGIELAVELQKQRRCPMIILSAFSDQELIDRAAVAGVFGYLLKPVSAQGLAAQMQVTISRFDEHERLLEDNQRAVAEAKKASAEKEELHKQLETRKLVERAKGIYMKHLQLDESEAHKRLQAESQKRRMSLADLAKKIIESEDLLGGG